MPSKKYQELLKEKEKLQLEVSEAHKWIGYFFPVDHDENFYPFRDRQNLYDKLYYIAGSYNALKTRIKLLKQNDIIKDEISRINEETEDWKNKYTNLLRDHNNLVDSVDKKDTLLHFYRKIIEKMVYEND